MSQPPIFRFLGDTLSFNKRILMNVKFPKILKVPLFNETIYFLFSEIIIFLNFISLSLVIINCYQFIKSDVLQLGFNSSAWIEFQIIFRLDGNTLRVGIRGTVTSAQ